MRRGPEQRVALGGSRAEPERTGLASDRLPERYLWTEAFAVCDYVNLADAQETTVTSTSLRSGKIEAIKIHYLIPRSHKVTHKRLLRVVTCVDFRYGSELGVRTED